jgi:gluconate 2-dehydrogenase gamma chain
MDVHEKSGGVPIASPRRRFLRGSALLAVGVALTAEKTRGLAAGVSPENRERWLDLFQESTPVAVEHYTPVALTDEGFATLRAAVNRIIPSDDLDPGADEAGVPIFIDRALVGPYAGQLEMY